MSRIGWTRGIRSACMLHLVGRGLDALRWNRQCWLRWWRLRRNLRGLRIPYLLYEMELARPGRGPDMIWLVRIGLAPTLGREACEAVVCFFDGRCCDCVREGGGWLFERPIVWCYFWMAVWEMWVRMMEALYLSMWKFGFLTAAFEKSEMPQLI